LEDNPVTKLLFQQCGFIPVQMANNGNGQANDYDRGSFKTLLKDVKRAFEEGFDIGILPEGQLNPTPEQGLLPIFSGAFTLAKMSQRRPIHMMAHYGIHNLWHPKNGMSPVSRNVKLRVYPESRYFESSDEFIATFNAIVGEYATYGRDLPAAELEEWTNGSAWEKIKEMNESK
jgi:1-acyl-sn-glycerol-3-phosphate acyltransferase